MVIFHTYVKLPEVPTNVTGLLHSMRLVNVSHKRDPGDPGATLLGTDWPGSNFYGWWIIITCLDPQSLLINIYKPKHDFGFLGLFMDRPYLPYFIDKARHEIHPKRPNNFSLAYLNTHQKNQFFFLVGGLGMSSSQLTFTPSFFRGVGSKPPTSYFLSPYLSPLDPEFLGFLGIHQPESVFHIAYEPHIFFFGWSLLKSVGLVSEWWSDMVSPSPGSAVPTVGWSETMVIPFWT